MSLANRIPTVALATAYVVAGVVFARPFLAVPAATAGGEPAVLAPPATASPGPAQAPPRVPTATPPGEPPTPTPAPAATPALPPVPVHVLRTCPIDGDLDLLPAAPLHIVFDQAMDTGPGATSVAITPTLAFRIEWLAPEHLLARTEPRVPGTEYRLTLTEARGATGGTLLQPLELNFGQGGRGAPIPILMYHHVVGLEGTPSAEMREWTVSPMQFASHLDLLASLGAHVVSLTEVADYLQSGEPLPARPVVITFDDANRSAYENAVPLLEARGWPATFFIPANYPGLPAYMSWAELAALAKAGYELGAHSYEHVRVHALSGAEAERQLGEAKREIEEQTGAQVRFFAYPFGYFSDRAIAQLKDYGYRAAVTINPTAYQKPGQQYILNRIRVGYGEPPEHLKAQLPWE